MNAKLTQFLTSNNAWIIIVAIVMICFQWVMTFIGSYGRMIYLHFDKTVQFFKMTGILIIVFLPFVLFSLFRGRLRLIVSGSIYHSVWGVVFIGYPIFLGLTDITVNLLPVTMQSEVLMIIGFVLSGIEFLSSPNKRLDLLSKFKINRQSISPEVIVIVIFVLLSIYGSFQLILDGASDGFMLVWLQNLAIISLYYLFYRINHYILLERIYKAKGLIYYVFSFLALEIVFFGPIVLLYYYLPAFRTLLEYNLGAKWIGSDAPTAFWSIYHGTPIMLMILTVPLAILIQWFKQSSKIDNLKKKKSETELNLLKQQINPHFFFNTLNNIYSLSLVNDKKTSEGILKLSELMRYVIYKGQEDWAPLSHELTYIEDYLDLQKLRIHASLDIRFTKSIDDSHTLVTPLMFIILVENAFKHGIENTESESYLHMSLSQQGNKIVFECENSVEDIQDDTTGGVGLRNLKRRLELLYPGRHNLRFELGEGSYKSILSLVV